MYHNLALKIITADHLVLDLYGNTIALIYKLFSVDTVYIRIFNIVIGVFTCFIIYLTGKEMADERIGIYSALIAAVYKPFLLYNIVLLKTTLSVFLFALTLYCLIYALNRNSRIMFGFTGLVVILLSNVRPNSLIFAPLIPVIMVWKYIVQGKVKKELSIVLSIYTIGICIVIVPFYFIGYEKPRAGTSQLAMNLYLGNNLQNREPYYRPVPFAAPIPGKQSVDFQMEARKRTGNKNLTEAEASTFWIHETVKGMIEHPPDFTVKVFQKILVVFNAFEAGDHYHVAFISNFAPFFKFPFPDLRLILPLGMTGLFLFGLRFSRMRPLVLLFFAYAATMVIFFTNTRYRLPMVVILIPFAVIGIRHLFSWGQERNFHWITVYCITVILFFIIEYLPLPGTGDFSAYYNTHAIILNSKGLKTEALQYWEKSSGMNKSFSVFADLSLAQYYMQNKNYRQANQYIDKIPDDSFAAAQKYGMLGDIYRRNGNFKQAGKAYETSLNINSSQKDIFRKLKRLR